MGRNWIALSTAGLALALNALTTSNLEADTIYLKNGSFIDGVISYRTEIFLELEIGKIGKIQIPTEEIYLIEKNKRTGEEAAGALVAARGKLEKVGGADSRDDGVDGADDADSSRADVEDRGPATRDRSGDDASGKEPSKDDVLGRLVDEQEISEELQKRIDSLLHDLQRHKSRYRVRAERQLKSIGRPAIRALLEHTRHKSDLVRIAIFRLFHSFGDERVIDACIVALGDLNEYVRDYANKTLVRVTGENLGYQPNASPRRRELVQRKWSKWWERELETLKENFAETSPGADEADASTK